MFYRDNFKKYSAFTAQQKAEMEAEFRTVGTNLRIEALHNKLRRLYPSFFSRVPPS